MADRPPPEPPLQLHPLELLSHGTPAPPPPWASLPLAPPSAPASPTTTRKSEAPVSRMPITYAPPPPFDDMAIAIIIARATAPRAPQVYAPCSAWAGPDGDIVIVIARVASQEVESLRGGASAEPC